ncbi:hypothetical protein BU107_13240 [Staphylococcus xylosus]|uniref:hypothetical protein n=1 Tax=Staphylococcus xylosus TaxID=1288 RepID=UPI000E6A006B|nr:hypothetical protein [Staphylococcus xylosus]RIM84752.1 hypothetical protein BU107_13240 [Staphylococcus xylosus]
MKTKINLISLLLIVISFITYYTTLYTTFFIDKSFSPWYFPGAVLFAINIVIAIIGIVNSTKWFNIISLILAIFYLLHFSFLLLLV